MLADALDLETRDIALVQNGMLTRVHSRSACTGRNCWIHNPSESPLSDRQVVWRADKRIAERICTHGIGHPDPDDVEYNRTIGRDTSVHGCDGCCEA